MKANERKFLAVLILVGVIIIAILLFVTNGKNKEEPASAPTGGTEQAAEEEEFVDVLPDGTKLNNSTKLAETKKVGELEISNLQLTEKGSQTVLLGTIKNNTTSAQGGYPATVTILDKEGKEVVELGAYINKVEAGEEQQFNVSSTLDYANAYDVKIEKD